jgi:ADP-dependent NAD(P)H-hydrate dehydratase / NAD(P)H-hydrate epimerase
MAPTLTPVYLSAQIRAIEQAALVGPSPAPLMERAGLAAAQFARDLLGGTGRRVLLFAGPGNNGGDAFVVARHLKTWQFEVSVVFAGAEEKLPADAVEALRAWKTAGGTMTDTLPATRDWDLIIDGLFGIGLERPIAGRYLEWVNWINACHARILCLDIPSGLHADSGRILGSAVRAAHTITFIGLKPGLLTLDGPDHAGEVRLESLGIGTLEPSRFGIPELALDAPKNPPSPLTGEGRGEGEMSASRRALALEQSRSEAQVGSKMLSRSLPESAEPHGWRIETALIASAIPPRQRNSHKGTFGNVGILGGAPGMVGAVLLAGRAALKLGTGRVLVGLLGEGPAVDFLQPELMLRSAQELLDTESLDCLAIGPGLGTSQAAQHAVATALAHAAPLVLDADALNLIANDTGLQKQLAARSAASILTPHPAEAARLLATSTTKIQEDRIAAARTLSERFNAAVVLKGNGSLCALKNGDWYINTSGNPGMATAGMGDVLTGIIASLTAQNRDPDQALLAGVHLHGLAADKLVASGIGPAGLTASEVIDAARQVLNTIRATSAPQQIPSPPVGEGLGRGGAVDSRGRQDRN